ncbi:MULTISPECIES: efflux RND transporter periplasmic adaptor subunit [Methylobacterium]|uniref:Solvent efflux pump periplasmic linker SrpA n=2 Tax=Pseudomonadota TaxID=1224 RepID=A0ABQ4SNR1_9HYPH|nr:MULTISPECIES: efflux RND transporter periplasmic adaptor subunit [Methylobacterium]PIU08650.1 MAG: efflux transporter periplasmic adaptor subunit [Methylobacterium sp. CG09_land_8_20_14_0_10_71_15]PIU15930.1 MAG: efflux transporter periplasmic adaptor subunit [Methylobacterium sp. CG08_land_8_20_14_0_20_71_15]GBU17683.1 multidrug efflux system [Methylobacterium sp.]GJE04859.1 Solvent efflux pump periplasmic linker SrpA [Methylobacterium jeotgali]
MTRHRHRRLRVISILAPGVLALALAACKPAGTETAASGAENPPPVVSTATVEAVSVPRTLDLPGRLASTRVAEVRAQVSGIVRERTFEEGSLVGKGDILFRIDPAVYKAEVDAREAALARAEATRVQAARQSERTETLLERQSASTAQHDIAIATLRQAEADVASAKAQLARARIDLDYATVRAPIAGRIGRAMVTEGALVGQGETTKLALIQQVDPIYADFNASASDPSFLADHAAGKAATEVRLVLADGSLHPDAGRLLFTDVSVDPGTGQVSLRATFPNPKVLLLPGTYVRIRVAQGMLPGAVVVPAQAIQRSSAGVAQAFVVGADKTLSLRPLRTGALTDAGWIVEEGLKPGETVVVEGFQKIQPGLSVNPVPWAGGRSAAASAQP